MTSKNENPSGSNTGKVLFLFPSHSPPTDGPEPQERSIWADDPDAFDMTDLEDPAIAALLAAFAHPDGLLGVQGDRSTTGEVRVATDDILNNVMSHVTDHLWSIENNAGCVELDPASLRYVGTNAVKPQKRRSAFSEAPRCNSVEGLQLLGSFVDVEARRELFENKDGQLFVYLSTEPAKYYVLSGKRYELMPHSAHPKLLHVKNLRGDHLRRLIHETEKRTRRLGA